ncbi:MAG: tetratricopeptide repeat protein [Bacteroidota bacterium]
MKTKLKFIGTAWMICVSFFVNAQTIDDGLKAIDNENYETARRIFLNYTKTNSTDAMGWYFLGNTYCFLEKNDSARIAYTQGTIANPKGTACFVGLGKTYLNENKIADAQKNFDEAKSLVNINKDINIAIYLADAYIYSENPNAEEAIRLLKQAENISINDYRVYMLMGDAYKILNKGGDAVTAYERCAALNKTNARPFARIGLIWNLARNYSQSKTAFDQALRIDPNFAPAYRDLAELYFNTAQYDKAKETFAKYLELADKNDVTQYRYAEFSFLTKDYEKCLQIINEMKARNPNNVNMIRLAAYCAYETGDYTNGLIAIENFFSKTDSKKILASDYEYYGKLLLKAGNDSLGALNIIKAIDMDSSKVDVLGDVAKLYYDKKNYGKAAFYYDYKIRKSAKPIIQDWFSLGRAYYFDSSYVLADTAFKHVTLISPAWPLGYLWRARSNLTMDKMDSTAQGFAVPYYQLVVEKATIDSVTAVKYIKELKEALR